ncbi:MAG: type IV pilus modification protein PilV [Cardiobacteriaceae bacterium]|nr:type IV pilus modification protein PilV [Cardiobacteriaceae bacterium]
MNIKRNKNVAGTVSCRIHQKGMTLLEVVVSMLVIGLGLAMSISMIQTANRFGNSAEFSHSALEQAQAIIDKIRANRVAAPTYRYPATEVIGSYDAIYESAKAADIGKLKISCTLPGIDSSDCDKAGKIAQTDMQAWDENTRALLPGGRGAVVINGMNSEVIVMWKNNPETDSNDNPDVQGIRVRFAL